MFSAMSSVYNVHRSTKLENQDISFFFQSGNKSTINNECDKLILTKMGLLLEWASYWNVASTGMGPQLEWGLHWDRASTGKGISTQTLFK